MTPLPLLPNEIWFYIADSLEADNRLLRKIVGMNRPFFEFAMDKLYHKFSITGTLSDPTLLEKSIRRLLDPLINCRVTALTICPHRLYEALLYRGIFFVPHLLVKTGFWGWIKECFIPSFPSPEEQTKRLFDALSCLKRLEMLSIEDESTRFDTHNGRLDPFRSSLFSFLWRTFGNTLLTLEVKVWDFKTAETLLEFAGIFSRLTRLVISIHGYDFISPIAPFFPLCPMVEILRINVVFKPGQLQLPDTDYGFNWKCLGYLLQNNPKIQELHICLHGWHDPPLPSLLNDSVSSEKDIGRNLPVLPVLRTLSLDFGSAKIKDDVIKYFGALTPNTLAMLSIRSQFLSYQDVKLILKVFNQCDMLVDLRLGIGCITSQLIDLFAERCPSLEKLGLQLDGHYLGKNQITLFEQEMSERKNYLHLGHVYKHWQLHELTLYPELGGFAYHHKAWSIMRAIANAVPSIRTVAGRDRSTALVETPMPHFRY